MLVAKKKKKKKHNLCKPSVSPGNERIARPHKRQVLVRVSVEGVGLRPTWERRLRTVPCTAVEMGIVSELLSASFLLKIVLHLCVKLFNPCVFCWSMSYIGGHFRLNEATKLTNLAQI